MENEQYRIAIAYDFDGTLVPGNMQEHSFIPKLGIDKAAFWQEADALARKNDGDPILTYMKLMLAKADQMDIPITRQAFEDYGKEMKFFPGVEEFFDLINNYAAEKNVVIDHYIISSGLREIIGGTSIAPYFKYIFASGFIFDANDVAIWPALAINYTTKTQYLFRINKGIENSHDNSRINKFVEYDRRPMPFSKMIYLGDGLTDVPAMKMIKYQGGTAIAVYDPRDEEKRDRPSGKKVCENLIEQKRADFMAAADYTEEGKLVKIIKTLIRRIIEEENLRRI